MEANEINKNQLILKMLISKSIEYSVHLTVDKCKKLGHTVQEPDFIASLCINFTPELFKTLQIIFPKKRFSTTGIFCHQKPLADFGTSKSPEIGDILFVYIYTNKVGDRKFNSLLLQAKISTKEELVIPDSENHQLRLYTKWPDFKYKRAGKLSGTERAILPKTIHDGAQYLLIDNDPISGLSGLSGTFPMGCAIPSKKLILNNDFTDEIIDFLKFKSGRTFEEKPRSGESKDDWTNLIWDIIEITKSKASKRNNAGLNSFPRQATYALDGYFSFKSDTNSIFDSLHNEINDRNNEYNNDNNSDFFDEENIAPSILLIECNEQSLNEYQS